MSKINGETKGNEVMLQEASGFILRRTKLRENFNLDFGFDYDGSIVEKGWLITKRPNN